MAKIAVIGDVLLDVYHHCVNRANPESSAPCYTVERTDYRLGGAGNVAANLAKLGSECVLISIVGKDEDAKILRRILASSGLEQGIVEDEKRQTVVKERYLSASDGRYHFRADFERREQIDGNHVREIMRRLGDCSMILVSDYNKGMISKELVEALKTRDIRIIADTKPDHIGFFRGVYVVKPNSKEIREMMGMVNEDSAASELVRLNGTNVLLTRGKDGISFFGCHGERYDFGSSTAQNQVVDVTGAGDSVIASFCHFLNKGHSLEKCTRLANIAGGISVQYPGCYQVSEKEILEATKE